MGDKQGRVEELECSQGCDTKQRVLVRECVGLMPLLAREDLIELLIPVLFGNSMNSDCFG